MAIFIKEQHTHTHTEREIKNAMTIVKETLTTTTNGGNEAHHLTADNNTKNKNTKQEKCGEESRKRYCLGKGGVLEVV